MALKLRNQYLGAVCQDRSRGNRRVDIFLHDTNRRCLLANFAETWANAGWQVHAFGLKAVLKKRSALVVVGSESRLQAVWAPHRLKPGLQTGILQRALVGKHFHRLRIGV